MKFWNKKISLKIKKEKIMQSYQILKNKLIILIKNSLTKLKNYIN